MSPLTKSEAIQIFLHHKTYPDLAKLYHIGMECQVNVAQDGGHKVDGEYLGRNWHGWTDGLTTWKSFRIPFKANTEPEYTDTPMRFDLEQHAEGIGMTGWNWVNKQSIWFAYDFDAIVGHSDKHNKRLTNEELESIKQATREIPWVSLRRSTSGSGLHLYVFLKNPTVTINHTEHAALARAILGSLSALTGFDFISKVDNCGTNMWVWHRKMIAGRGLSLIKAGEPLEKIPTNWRDHINVVKGTNRKTIPQNIAATGQADNFIALCGQISRVRLDEEHKRVINYLKENATISWWWDQDNHMLVTHTLALKRAHQDLSLKGYFETSSPGSNINEQNCFCFPMSNGAWSIRRYTLGVAEHESWEQDGSGWTRCYYNREPDFKAACRAHSGIEDTKGGFVFREAEKALKAAQLLGAYINLDTKYLGRKTILKQHKDGRLVIQLDREDHDNNIEGWLLEKYQWQRIVNVQVNPAASDPSSELGNYDDMIRHLATLNHESYGWVLRTEEKWYEEPVYHIKTALASLGINSKDVTTIMGTCIFRPWTLVNKPFQSEYPGDREWNREAAQLRFMPTADIDDLKYDTWRKILAHCGSGLDDVIKDDPWCQVNQISNGADYLKCWVASLIQNPTEPLPYLFFWGEQNSGKSIFHEAIELLFTKGVKRADVAITNQQGFNKELEGQLLCVIEETDLSKNAMAYNRIKDWVTGRSFLVHPKNETPYHVDNTTHWVQCANSHAACPIFPGDTRITMCYVKPLELENMIPKRRMIPMLEAEAPDFLAELLRIEIPESDDRLILPVISTPDKEITTQLNKTQLEVFISERCLYVPGYKIKFGDFYGQFISWLDPNDTYGWSKIRVGRELPPNFPKGRQKLDAQFYIGNMVLLDKDGRLDGKEIIISSFETRPPIIVRNNYMEEQ